MGKRYGAQVPQYDLSVQGMRVVYKGKYRGQELQLRGTVQARIWDRSLGMNVWRITPDRLEEYGNITHFAVSVRESDLVKDTPECERCGDPGASSQCITVILDHGFGNGTSREEVTYTLCRRCAALAQQCQPVDPDQFFDYEPVEALGQAYD